MFSRMFGRDATAPRQPAPKGAATLGPSAHVDTFARDNLPPTEQREGRKRAKSSAFFASCHTCCARVVTRANSSTSRRGIFTARS